MSENIWRKDFPILNQQIYGKPLVYLDNAATSQMPVQVMDRIRKHYEEEHANIHRGIHFLSERSTEAVEDARKTVQKFINAEHAESVIFTQGTTDSIHLVSAGIALELAGRGKRAPAGGFGAAEGSDAAGSGASGSAVNTCGRGSAWGIVTTQMEHHSNYVPWQQICRQTGAEFFVCPAPDGELDLEALETILKDHRIRLVACAHVSNVTGTVNPLEEVIALAHRYGAQVLVDGAQGILHFPVDVQKLDCEYYCFSGHKMLGPTGIGVLYGKKECLEALPPVRYGGGMVDLVTEEETTWGLLPLRFEAGTPNISGIIGLGAAVGYLNEHNFDAMHAWEANLLNYTLDRVSALDHVRILGHPARRAGAVSFAAEGAHPYDIASMLDKAGVAVRSGHHCAQPILQCLGETSAVRISPNFYNTREEIDICCENAEKIISLLRKYS